jgi:hypothetical protein
LKTVIGSVFQPLLPLLLLPQLLRMMRRCALCCQVSAPQLLQLLAEQALCPAAEQRAHLTLALLHLLRHVPHLASA